MQTNIEEPLTNERLRVTVYDGKYTVVQAEEGGLRCLRYGKEWRDCLGDGLILALAQEVRELREYIRENTLETLAEGALDIVLDERGVVAVPTDPAKRRADRAKRASETILALRNRIGAIADYIDGRRANLRAPALPSDVDVAAVERGMDIACILLAKEIRERDNGKAS